MALNGLQIHKLLPQTNCKECGSNTCLAFAMKLAGKKATLADCPYASEEAKRVLGADSEPPVKAVSLGGEKPVKLGGETVLYRHEKTFVNQTLLAVNVDDDADYRTVLGKIRNYRLERVGETLAIDAVSVRQVGSDDRRFLDLARAAGEIGLPLIVRSPSAGAVAEAARLLKGTASVLASTSAENAEARLALARENGHALAVSAPDMDGLCALTGALRDKGFADIILQFDPRSLAESFQVNSIARRAAIKDNFKPLGYPSLAFIDTGDALDDTAAAVTQIAKYGSICVLPGFDAAQLAALMTLRLNLYTDPQKPIQVEPRIYAVGEPNRNSPVFVTTNFSLTYFLVTGEIENSGTSAWLVVPECEGFSVLTAWAAGKFSGSQIAKFVKESGLEDLVDTREIVIPGYVAQISGELEEALGGWKALVGPQEAADLEAYIKAVLKRAS